MTDELMRFLSRATELRGPQVAGEAWSFDALRGRLVEISARGASAALTCAVDLVAEAQGQGEPVAWVTLATGSFYPPDVADSGIDLAALVVIRVPDALAAVGTLIAWIQRLRRRHAAA